MDALMRRFSIEGAGHALFSATMSKRYGRGLRLACFSLLVAGSTMASAGTVFSDSFDYPNGLITNEYAEWNPGSSSAVISNVWEMTSGSLFAQYGTGWTGVPDSCGGSGSPNAASSTCTNSDVFRLNSKQTFSGSVRVSFAIRQNQEIHDAAGCDSKNTCWHGAHIWLRYVNQYNLYYASIQRADGKVVIKRKVPCGSDNSGTYFTLSSYVPHDWSIGSWKRYSASVETNADNSVTIKLYDDDQSTTVPVAVGIDKGGTNPSWSASCTTSGHYSGSAYSPITQAGSVGVRGDYANFNIDNFTVTADSAPVASITSPANNATVSGTVKIAADVTDSLIVSHLDFYVDGALLGTSTAAPYTYGWNTAGVAAGTHTLIAKAYNKAGEAGASSPAVTVNVASYSTPADTIAPVASISSPASGATVSGKVNVVANATDAVGVTKVEFYVNNILKLTDTTDPYAFAWDTTALPNGAYTLSVKAYDSAGNVGTSIAVPVTVANGAASNTATTPGLSVTTTTTSSWSGGYCKTVFVKNTTASPITWKVALTISGTITSLWDAVGAVAGTTLALTGKSYNSVIQPGATIKPGFCAKT